jgi:hypothetical protein
LSARLNAELFAQFSWNDHLPFGADSGMSSIDERLSSNNGGYRGGRAMPGYFCLWMWKAYLSRK